MLNLICSETDPGFASDVLSTSQNQDTDAHGRGVHEQAQLDHGWAIKLLKCLNHWNWFLTFSHG